VGLLNLPDIESLRIRESIKCPKFFNRRAINLRYMENYYLEVQTCALI